MHAARQALQHPKPGRAHPADAGHHKRWAVCRCNAAAHAAHRAGHGWRRGVFPAGLGRAGLPMWAAFYGDQWQKTGEKLAVSALTGQKLHNPCAGSNWAFCLDGQTECPQINENSRRRTFFLLQRSNFQQLCLCPWHQGFPLHGSVSVLASPAQAGLTQQGKHRKKSRKNKGGNFWQKKAREISPRFNLQRRNRGETIKKQLLHLNEYGLSRPTVTLSTLFMLLGIIFVKNCRCRANKMFISEHQRYIDPATGNSAIGPEHACTSGAADGICATITPILCPSSGTLPCRCCCLIPACTPVLTPITC